MKWIHECNAKQTTDIIQGMKAQLQNLRTALWWFQRQSEAQQLPTAVDSNAFRSLTLPALMNAMRGASPKLSTDERAVLDEHYSSVLVGSALQVPCC